MCQTRQLVPQQEGMGGHQLKGMLDRGGPDINSRPLRALQQVVRCARMQVTSLMPVMLGICLQHLNGLVRFTLCPESADGNEENPNMQGCRALPAG